MFKLTSIFLLFVLSFFASLQAQQWELVDFGEGINPSDEVICSVNGIKEPIPGELYALVSNEQALLNSPKAIAKSTDGGQTWTKTWLPSNLTKVQDFLINPLSPNEWYVTRFSSNNSTSQYLVYKSVDFGQTWTSFGQGLLNPPQSPSIGTVKFVEFEIDFTNGTLVGMLEEVGWDWVDYYATERGVNDSSWTNSLFATSTVEIWGIWSNNLKADREETPNVFWINGGGKKSNNYPSFSNYGMITTTNDTIITNRFGVVENSDLLFSNLGNTIYKNEFGWSGNGNWEVVNWNFNGVPLESFSNIWGDGNGFLLIFLDYVIDVNGQDFFVFYSNNNGNTWQVFPFFNGLPNGIFPKYISSDINFSKKMYARLSISENYDFYKFDLSYLITTLKEKENKIETFNLSQNYPNPFNPETSINYQFPINERGKLIIFNTLGQQIKELELIKSKGSVIWNGTNNVGNSVSSGVYFYQLKSDKFTQTKSMTLIK